MEYNEFMNKIKVLSSDLGIELTEKHIKSLYIYMNELIEWNQRINLTAITDPDEIIIKHFIDSLTINQCIESNKKIIDIGTGAGFPGLPIGICREDLDILLIDSLNKRINFLNSVCEQINLENVQTCHARVEEIANNSKYRAKFNYATSRAVAPLNILLEYMLPFVEKGGYCICMKGSNISDEIEDAKKALDLLGGVIEKIDEFNLPNTDIKRNIIIIKKVKDTPNKYPRKPGTPSRDPII